MKDKKIKMTIKQSDLPKSRVGKGYTVRPMVEKDQKKEKNKKSCRNYRY